MVQELGLTLIVLAIAGGLILASIAVWALAAVNWWSGERLIPWRERRPDVWSPTAVALVAIWTAVNQGAALTAPTPREDITLRDVQATSIVSLVTVIVLLGVLAVSRRGSLADFGVRLRQSGEQAYYGLGGFLASWLPVLMVSAATIPLRSPENQHVFLQFVREDAGPIAILWTAVAAAVLAPLAEELMFRVVLQGALEVFLPPAAAIGVVAILFSFVHGWPDVLPIIPLALILGYVFHRQRSYVAVVVLHALFNLAMLSLTLLAPETVPEGPVGG